jgi:hypothetical protein
MKIRWKNGRPEDDSGRRCEEMRLSGHFVLAIAV